MPFYIFTCSHSEASSTTTLCLCCLACSSTWAALLWCLVQALAKPVDTCLRFTTVALHNLKQWDFCFRQGTLYSTYPWVTTEMIVSLNKLITLTSGISMSWLNMLRHFTTKKYAFDCYIHNILACLMVEKMWDQTVASTHLADVRVRCWISALLFYISKSGFDFSCHKWKSFLNQAKFTVSEVSEMRERELPS